MGNRTKLLWGPFGDGVPEDEYRRNEARGKRRALINHGGASYMPDISEFQSPIDYSLISSRSQLREHEQRHGVRQVGELKTASDFDPNRTKPYEPVVGRRR